LQEEDDVITIADDNDDEALARQLQVSLVHKFLLPSSVSL